jgi:hypothetical protein
MQCLAIDLGEHRPVGADFESNAAFGRKAIKVTRGHALQRRKIGPCPSPSKDYHKSVQSPGPREYEYQRMSGQARCSLSQRDHERPFTNPVALGVASHYDAMPSPNWRLLIYLELGTRRQTVSIDYVDRNLLEAHVEQFNPSSPDQYRLLNFENELGESLAVVWCAYVRHEIRSLP